ncbi:MAG: patatin-like phospholipase family protein [Candidatus Polarisedimenticolia bacterium]
MPRRPRFIWTLLLLGAMPASAPVAQPQREKICLALAGGGARGGAHVGAIKVLEELRIPVDCIAGTSIGSIVGALYALGYSPDQMSAIIQGMNWEDILNDRPERRRISFRRKEDDRFAFFPMEIGIGPGGMQTKSGVFLGTKIDFIFQGLTVEAVGARSFDELKIPYRAVAADLATGKAVVLDRGDLARAMRASMALPAFFTPVVIDGRTLVDGGIADNLPVDVARSILPGSGVRIIAIDVGTPPETDLEKLSAVGVLNQTLSVMSELTVIAQRASLGPRDLLITPDLKDIGSGSFQKLGESIAAGEEAARQATEQLRAFSVSEDEYKAFLSRQRRDQWTLTPSVIVDEIEVRGVTALSPKVVTERMETKPGQPLDLDTLREDLDRIHMLGEFQSVGFDLEEVDGRERLIVDAQQKSWGPGYLKFGMGMETNFEGDADVRLLGYYRRAHVNKLGAELKVIGSLGTPTAITGEFFQPLEPTGFWFVAPSGLVGKEQGMTFLPPGEMLEVADEKRWQGGLDLGAVLRNWGEIRLGVVAGRAHFGTETTSDFVPYSRQIGAFRFRAALDQLDNVFFPTRGFQMLAQAIFSREGLGATDEYEKVSFSTLHAWTVGRDTVLAGLEVGSDLGSDIPIDDQFTLGGFLRLSGFKRGRLRGDVAALVSLGDYWKLGQLGPFGRLYAGAVLQAGNTWPDADDVDWSDLVFSGLVFFGVDTRAIPVYLGYGLAEGGEGEVYFFIGSPFLARAGWTSWL